MSMNTFTHACMIASTDTCVPSTTKTTTVRMDVHTKQQTLTTHEPYVHEFVQACACEHMHKHIAGCGQRCVKVGKHARERHACMQTCLEIQEQV